VSRLGVVGYAIVVADRVMLVVRLWLKLVRDEAYHHKPYSSPASQRTIIYTYCIDPDSVSSAGVVRKNLRSMRRDDDDDSRQIRLRELSLVCRVTE